MKNELRDPLVAQSLATVILLFALIGGVPPSYNLLLRFAVCALCAYLAVNAYLRSKLNWVWLFGALVVLYNPLFPVRLNRDVWFDAYGGTIALMVLAMWMLVRNYIQLQNATALKQQSIQAKENFWGDLPIIFGFSSSGSVDRAKITEIVAVRECQCCSQRKMTRMTFFVENVSYLFGRQEQRIEGYICFACMTYTFVTFELRTLILTWWGIVGLCVGPFYLLWNLFEYAVGSYRFANNKWMARNRESA